MSEIAIALAATFGKRLRAKIEVFELVHPTKPLEGCSDEVIEAVQAAQQVTRLPATYHSFLRYLGRQAGVAFEEWLYDCAYLMRIRHSLLEALQEEKVEYKIPKNAFYFANSWGDYLFFDTSQGDDPTVYSLVFHQGNFVIKMIHPRFSSYLDRIVRRTGIIKARYEGKRNLNQLKLRLARLCARWKKR